MRDPSLLHGTGPIPRIRTVSPRDRWLSLVWPIALAVAGLLVFWLLASAVAHSTGAAV